MADFSIFDSSTTSATTATTTSSDVRIVTG